MDDNHEDSKYAANYGLNYGSQNSGKYVDEDDDEVEEADEQDETNVGDNEVNGYTQQNVDDDNCNDDDVDDDDDDDDDGDDGEDHNVRKRNNVIQQRHPKKRKLKSLLLSSYEFAPRVPPPTSAPKPSFGGRNTLTDWTEHETFVLLEAWGNRFLQCGRKSLRSEEWQQVAERVSQESKMERTDSQCRNRLDTVKKKYKKEKANLKGGRSVDTKWVYFKKMDMLSSSSSNPTNSLNTANGVVDETRGSSGNSETRGGDDDDDDDDDDDLLPIKILKPENSFKLLADSINKFSEIYEKIEKSKIEQMIELEKMRMDFHKDLELQKRQILDRAQTEISKVRQGDYEDNDVSAENVSG